MGGNRLTNNRDNFYEYRIHVCPLIGKIYVFSANSVKQAVGKKAIASTDGRYVTSEGILVNPRNLNAKEYDIPWDILQVLREQSKGRQATSSNKGRLAEMAVVEMLRRGLLRGFSQNAEITTDRDEQLAGIDIWAGKTPIQVKMDYRGGDKSLGGTGNLYIEVASHNIYREY